MTPLHLGFHYHIPMMADEQGQLHTPGYLGRFLDSLAEHCASLACFMHSPRPDELAQMDYTIQSPNVRWIDIGPHTSIPKRTLNARRISRPLQEQRHALDALLIRGPSPMLPSMAKAAGDVPVALLLVGDYLAGVDDLPQPRWRKEAIRAWSYWNYRQQLAIARKTLTFVNSHKLYDQLHPHVPNLYETRTTTLSADDFFERDDTCQGKPVRLLYTGRINRAKGLFQMVEAVALLVKAGEEVVLDLVGWPQKGDTVVDELQELAREQDIADRVFYHGFKPVGPALFQHYKDADIYVIASTSSFEGFPRTIWEAMAHSLPVVATCVGSIPHYLEHERTAMLIAPRDSRELATAVQQLIHEQTLRQRLIKNGIAQARSNTLKARSEELVSQIEKWICGK